jgi:hypothetical protein
MNSRGLRKPVLRHIMVQRLLPFDVKSMSQPPEGKYRQQKLCDCAKIG